MPVTNRFASIVAGSPPFAADRKDDSDSSLYERVGTSVPLGELLDLMIQRSSNLATNTLIDLVGARRVDSTAHALGAVHMRVLRGVEDSAAFARGLNNVVTAFRAAVLGRDIDWLGLTISAAAILVVFVAGCLYFRRVEDGFADLI